MESTLGDLLHQALGEGDDAGSVNFKTLKFIIASILGQLGIEQNLPPHLPPSDSKLVDFQSRFHELEKIVENLTRPNSPDSLFESSSKGEAAIRNDWEKSKLKKRVEANEESIQKALDILDKLAQQIKGFNNLNTPKGPEVDYNKAIEDINSKLQHMDDKMYKIDELKEQLDGILNQLAQIEISIAELRDQMKSKVSWGNLDDTFKQDFFKMKTANDIPFVPCCAAERAEYPTYFKGLGKLADYGDSIRDIQREIGDLTYKLESFKIRGGKKKETETNIAEIPVYDRKKSIKPQNQEVVEEVPSMEYLDNKLKDIVRRTSKVRSDIELQILNSQTSLTEEHFDILACSKDEPTVKFIKGQDGVNSGGKAGVVSHGGTHRKSVGEILGPLGSISFQDININECESALSLEATKSLDDTIQLNEDLAIIAEASLDIRRRVSQQNVLLPGMDQYGPMLKDHQLRLNDHSNILTDHESRLGHLAAYETDMEHISEELTSLKRGQARANLPSVGGTGGDPLDMETIDKLKKSLSGTKLELQRLAELMTGLMAEGNQKNQELSDLNRLLHDLTEKAAMQDFVTNKLDSKADKSDIDELPSKDDLEATAQTIVNQLEQVIGKQAETEKDLVTSIQRIGEEMGDRTRTEEFNPFKDEIESKLRSLRIKLEKLSKDDLKNLSTAAGAAGFRQQLFNCISCDKTLLMKIKKPLLPEPSGFPARISLRPHTSYNLENARCKDAEDAKILIDLLRNENTSQYSSMKTYKDQERKKMMHDNKIRQEINSLNFKPCDRQAGAAPKPGKLKTNKSQSFIPYYADAERKELKVDKSEVDLEGINGQLYKGRFQKLPGLGLQIQGNSEERQKRPFSACSKSRTSAKETPE